MKRIRSKRHSGKTSKRLSVHDKHKIEKRVAQHNKKMRRTARLSGIRKGKPKAASIPNSCPFKLELLQEMQEKKQEELRLREELRQRRRQVEVDGEFQKVSQAAESASLSTELQTFIESLGDPDVVIEVLEASDPEFYRLPDLEQWAITANKRLLLALNKSDLVDPATLEAWLQHYSSSFQCIATSKKTAKQKLAILRAVGLDAISATGKIAVVGFPNVGKSSLANVILGDKRMRVSTQPGCTAENFTLPLESHISVVVTDTVGITALSTEEQPDDPLAVLKRVSTVDQCRDPFTPVQGILMKFPKEKLMEEYGVPQFANIQEFLGEVAKKQELYKRPGMVDYEGAAKVVLFDWATRKLRYEVTP